MQDEIANGFIIIWQIIKVLPDDDKTVCYFILHTLFSKHPDCIVVYVMRLIVISYV